MGKLEAYSNISWCCTRQLLLKSDSKISSFHKKSVLINVITRYQIFLISADAAKKEVLCRVRLITGNWKIH